MLNEISCYKVFQLIRYHRTGKFIDPESIMKVTRDCRKKKCGVIFLMAIRVSIWDNLKVLKLDSSDGLYNIVNAY